jgi:hypothetical protein
MPDLLSIIVDRWKTSSKGISALEMKDILGISHEDTMARLRELEAEGLIRLRECQLGEPVEYHETRSGDTIFRIGSKFEMVDTLMAFPSNAVLEDAFFSDRKDYGEFTNRMHRGASQVQHYYFKREVLDKYLKQRDRYEVEQDSVGGSVGMTSEYYMSLSETDQDALGFAAVRFGNMKLADGTEAIGAIAKDLDSLPKADQHHWAAHEIQSPTLDSDDKAWTDYIDEQFEGNWGIDHTDYIKRLSESLERVNKVVGPLFRKTKHPGLHVPGLNTYSEYIAAHKELHKLIGPDNLSEEVLKTALRATGCQDADLVHESGRPKGKWDLLGMLAGRKGLDWKPLKAVATHRQDDGHRIREKRRAASITPRSSEKTWRR